MKIISEPGMVEAWYGNQMNRVTFLIGGNIVNNQSIYRVVP